MPCWEKSVFWNCTESVLLVLTDDCSFCMLVKLKNLLFFFKNIWNVQCFYLILFGCWLLSLSCDSVKPHVFNFIYRHRAVCRPREKVPGLIPGLSMWSLHILGEPAAFPPHRCTKIYPLMCPKCLCVASLSGIPNFCSNTLRLMLVAEARTNKR